MERFRKYWREKILFSDAGEFLLELFDAACRIDKAFFAGISRMGIRGDVARNHKVIYAVNCFDRFAFHSGTRKETRARRYVDKAYGVNIWMNFVFHADICSKG